MRDDRLPSPSQMETLNPHVIRRLILEQSRRAGIGQVGSCLSNVEILVGFEDWFRGRHG